MLVTTANNLLGSLLLQTNSFQLRYVITKHTHTSARQGTCLLGIYNEAINKSVIKNKTSWKTKSNRKGIQKSQTRNDCRHELQ